MIVIYHNPRCSKSRAGLAYLESKGAEFEVRQYFKDQLTAEELKDLIRKTGLQAIELVRQKEDYFKKNLKGRNFTDDVLIEEMIKEPKLIQRPIICNGDKAVLANPPECLDDLLRDII